MARTDTLKNFLTDVADKLREKLGTTEPINHADYDTKIDAVYDKGILEGEKKGWGPFQNFGQPKSYCCAFVGWDEKYFYPKYDIVLGEGSGADDANSAASVFRRFQSEKVNGVELKKPIDLAQRLEECGVILDTSRATSFMHTFSLSNISRAPIIDISNALSMGYMLFYYSKVETIDKLILKDDGSQTTNSNNFEGCSNLKNITIEGVIGSTFNIRWSTLLTKASIESIVNALSDKQGASLILSKTAVNREFGSDTSDEWIETIADKVSSYNGVTYDGLWTISLL